MTCEEHRRAGTVLPQPVSSLQLFKQTWRQTECLEQSNPRAKATDTHKESQQSQGEGQEAMKSQNKTNPWGGKNRQGFKGRLWLGNLFDFPLFSTNSLRAARKTGRQTRVRAFSIDEKKTSSAGTEICLQEGRPGNYKTLKQTRFRSCEVKKDKRALESEGECERETPMHPNEPEQIPCIFEGIIHCQILLGHLPIQKVESDVITLIPSCCVTQQSALPAFQKNSRQMLSVREPDNTSDWWLLPVSRPWLLCETHRGDENGF